MTTHPQLNPVTIILVESYHGDGHQVSVSGISSGGCMATQFHVVYSSRVMGAGVIAGGTNYICKFTGILLN